MKNKQFRAARALAAIFLSTAALASSAATTPTTGQFLQILQKQIASDDKDQFAVTGLNADEHGRQFAAAILTKLSEQKAYRDELQEWLIANAATTQEELVSNWWRHYQKIRLDSFEFLDDRDVSILFRMPGMHPLYGSARQGCQTRSPDETLALVPRTRHSLIDEHKDRLAGVIAAAYVRELARIQHPSPGDRPVGQVQTMRVMAAFKRLGTSLPAADAAILDKEYSYGKRAPGTPQEECDHAWLATHAILDASVSDASLLRQSVTHAEYSAAFGRLAPGRVPLRARPGFTPGKAFVSLPELLERRNVKGAVSVKVSVDEAGNVSGVAAAWNSLMPTHVTSANGETFASMDLLLPVFDKYYRDGKFAPHLVNGNPVPFSFSQEVDWK
ncbi:hypothetical protein PO883_28445 [Massilia sp. DJPM01]|uniref:hypothetical protein n=1 Tax=Massilia sp. DJPM01 TaxID=3024404 RepID=UPI00259DFBFF|nr:hypothetical protein [Massilia sp. DJPM01]MDM5181118.1 hypothetical protein [Massilia sp. DJPM01]